MRNYSSKEYFRDCAGAPSPSLPLIFCPPTQVRQFVLDSDKKKRQGTF